ncbi:MAG TPA: methyltransferase domain-containing protein [Myxococcota bacterium]|nr:methyltransferase domain-containing protein [Myxococcota bacterium]
MSQSLDQRVLSSAIGALELFGLYLGDRLGLYAALRDGAPRTPEQLAAECGIHPRYAREWLEQQAVAGVLEVAQPSEDGATRAYVLPEAHVGVVADPDHPAHLAPLGRMLAGIGRVLEEVVAAYRSGGGVPYARYGAEFRHGQGGINRPAFGTSLVDAWLPAVPGLAERLASGGRVAELGCGQGYAAVAIAKRFPNADVWGLDNDAASIEDARGYAAAQSAKVRFECADAAALASAGPFDAVLLLEVLHDLARPVEVLAGARRALGPEGVVVVADELVAPGFTAPGDELERMMYGWSIVHCLPTQMAESPSAAIGTVIREGTVRELAQQAGFASTRVLDVDGGFFRLYELR